MKTIEQLLELTKNPYYKLTTAERLVLDDFLAKKQVENSKSFQKKNSKNSERSSHVRVRNVVNKTILEPEESGL